MPYIDGKRVTNEEWSDRYGSIKKLHTGPNGENPGEAVEVEPETGAPASKAKKAKADTEKAGGKRSQRSEKAAKGAVADALGVKSDSPSLDGIDLADLDAKADDKS